MRVLSDLYRHGYDGVPQDSTEAEHWTNINWERIGIDINFLEGLTITPELIQETFRGIEPVIVSCGEAISVLK